MFFNGELFILISDKISVGRFEFSEQPVGVCKYVSYLLPVAERRSCGSGVPSASVLRGYGIYIQKS